MVAIVICAIILYVIANAPLLYSLRYVHKLDGTAKLWGHAPNQFFFLVVIYPFATIATLGALHTFAFRLLPILPKNLWLKFWLDNWPAATLFGIIVAALLSIIVYFTSSWSFDKLKPEYARMALEAAQKVDSQVRNSSRKKEEQQEYRNQLTGNARDDMSTLELPLSSSSADINAWITNLKPEVYLQVTQDSKRALHLRLFDPVVHALNVFQMFSALFVASCALLITILCIYCAHAVKYDFVGYPEMANMNNAAFWAVFLLGLYSICYHQHRIQVEDLVGTGRTVMQDVITGVVVVGALVYLRALNPANRDISFDAVLKFSPVLLFGGGSIFGVLTPQVTKQVIGSDANVGVHIIISLLVLIAACIAVVPILLRR